MRTLLSLLALLITLAVADARILKIESCGAYDKSPGKPWSRTFWLEWDATGGVEYRVEWKWFPTGEWTCSPPLRYDVNCRARFEQLAAISPVIYRVVAIGQAPGR